MRGETPNQPQTMTVSGTSGADDVRRGIHEILRIALNVEPPDADADLVQSSVLDSLAIITLIAEIEERFAIRVPLERLELADVRTIASLERLVMRQRAADPAGPLRLGADTADGAGTDVQVLRSGSNAPPVFLLPGAWGFALGMLPLARSLSTDGTIYALQTWGSASRAAPPYTVPELAARSLQAILAVESEGPFTLVGYSFGGQVAYELARLLRERGTPVRLLVLIDTRVSPAALPPLACLRVLVPQPLRYVRYILARPGQRSRQSMRKLARLVRGRRAWAAELRAAELQAAELRAAELIPAPEAPERDPFMRAIAAAARSYRPGRYAGDAALLVSDTTHPLVCSALSVWRDRVDGTLTVMETPGEHGRIISVATDAVARSVDRLLAEYQPDEAALAAPPASAAKRS